MLFIHRGSSFLHTPNWYWPVCNTFALRVYNYGCFDAISIFSDVVTQNIDCCRCDWKARLDQSCNWVKSLKWHTIQALCSLLSGTFRRIFLRPITLLVGCLWLMINAEGQWTVERLSCWATYYTFGVFVTSGRWKWPGQGKLDEMKENLTFAFYQLLKSRGVAFIAAGLVFPACKQFSVFSLQFSWVVVLYSVFSLQ